MGTPRRRRSSAWVWLVSSIVFASAMHACRESEVPDRPNVVLFIVDTLRADALGAYGSLSSLTPSIDAFAAEAMLFEVAEAPSSWTRPSIASLFTGQLPSLHRTETREDDLWPGVPTLAELMREAGYSTAFITVNPNTASFYGFDRGFDHMEELYRRTSRGHVKTGEVVTSARQVVSRAIAWLSETQGPFLLVLLSADPHAPYSAPKRLLARARAARRAVELPAATPHEDELRDAYAAEVATTDLAFERLLGHLEESGRSASTIVVLTSDHGEEFYEHGYINHGRTLFEEVTRVPLILRYPGRPELAVASRVVQPVQMLDLFATILDLVGIDAPSPTDGRSLLEAEARGARTLISQLRVDDRDLVSARRGDWKLIRDIGSGDLSLFDLAADPAEQRPLGSEDGDSLVRIRDELIEALDRIPRRQRSSRASPRAETIPEDVRAALEQMGYIEPGSSDEAAGHRTQKPR